MNPLIRELQVQAFELCKTHKGNLVVTDEVFTKFAELIVRECAGIVTSLDQYEGPGDSPTADYIKEHFGVDK